MRLRAGAHPHVMVASAGGHAFLPNKLHQISNENFSSKYIAWNFRWKLFYHNYYIRFQWKFFYQTSYTKFPMKTCLLNKLHQISNENLSTKKIYQFTMNAFLPSKLHQIFKENSFSKLHQISNENFCAKWIISNSQRKLAVIYRTELTCRPSALNLHMWEMIQAAAICRLGAQVFSISQRPYSK